MTFAHTLTHTSGSAKTQTHIVDNEAELTTIVTFSVMSFSVSKSFFCLHSLRRFELERDAKCVQMILPCGTAKKKKIESGIKRDGKS